MLVAVAVLGILLVIAAQIITRTSSIWISSKSKMSQGREARVAFTSIVSRLSQATVNNYYGYTFTTAGVPNSYVRRSELRFISGPSATINPGVSKSPTHSVFFVAPLGIVSDSTYSHLPSLLNVCGYYISWSKVDPGLPSILSSTNTPYRFRLMQFVQPAEQMSIYDRTIPFATDPNGNYPQYLFRTGTNWQKVAMVNSSATGSHLLANNVVALFFVPAMTTTDSSGSLAPDFVYSTETATTGATAVTTSVNRLPPVLRVVMYTIDDKSALRLTQAAAMPNLYVDTASNPLFTDATKFFPNASSGDIGDLGRFEQTLVANRLTFRRFDAAVELPRQPWNTRN